MTLIPQSKRIKLNIHSCSNTFFSRRGKKMEDKEQIAVKDGIVRIPEKCRFYHPFPSTSFVNHKSPPEKIHRESWFQIYPHSHYTWGGLWLPCSSACYRNISRPPYGCARKKPPYRKLRCGDDRTLSAFLLSQRCFMTNKGSLQSRRQWVGHTRSDTFWFPVTSADFTC